MSEEPNFSSEDTQIGPVNAGQPAPQSVNETSSGEEVISLSTQNPDTNIPAMEVQKHPHHVTHKKKLGEYLLEFLMIFLAVFLGFIAENIRERYVEHHRAKEYAQSLYNDLKKDTADLHRAMNFELWQNRQIDSLIICMHYTDTKMHARELYYYSCFANLPNLPFRTSEITIQQLRNSGSLRYFTSVPLYNMIAQYYADCAFYLDGENDIRQLIPSETLLSKIFVADQLALMYNDDRSFSFNSLMNNIHWPANHYEFKLVDSYLEAWNEYVLYIQRLRRRKGLPPAFLSKVENEQKQLMTALKREFDVN